MKDLELAKFIELSNHIEGEHYLPIDVKSLKAFLHSPITEESLNKYHKSISGNQEWSGRYRNIQVYVGNYIPPSPWVLRRTMKNFIKNLQNMSAWEAHNEFEMIHPYQDFNGRMGRVIRLHKMQGTYKGKISFLHMYYYQTLSAYEKS